MFHNLPDTLRSRRRACDLTQEQLAARCGAEFTQQYVSALERGFRPTNPRHVETLARALEVTPEELLRRPRKVRRLNRTGFAGPGPKSIPATEAGGEQGR